MDLAHMRNNLPDLTENHSTEAVRDPRVLQAWICFCNTKISCDSRRKRRDPPLHLSNETGSRISLTWYPPGLRDRQRELKKHAKNQAQSDNLLYSEVLEITHFRMRKATELMLI